MYKGSINLAQNTFLQTLVQWLTIAILVCFVSFNFRNENLAAAGERQHQLADLKLQMQVQHEGHNQQTVQISAIIAERLALYQHAATVGIAWVEGLRASV